MDISPHHTLSRTGKGQFLFRAGDPYIAEPALFFQFLRIISCNGHVTGEQSVLQPRQVYPWELQSLCAVQGHEHHIILVLIQTVNIRHKSDFFQESAERCHLIPVRTVLLISRSLTDQLIDILYPRLGIFRVVRIQIFNVSGLLDHLI